MKKQQATSEKVQQWTNDYQNYLDNPPEIGTVLRAYGDEDARLDLELNEGKPPFLYGRAYVPCVVGQPLGWYLQPFDSNAAYGWKCILLPKAREDALRRLGVKSNRLKIKALKIVRYSATGQAILCEVAEFCPFEPTGATVAVAPDEQVVAEVISVSTEAVAQEPF